MDVIIQVGGGKINKDEIIVVYTYTQYLGDGQIPLKSMIKRFWCHHNLTLAFFLPSDHWTPIITKSFIFSHSVCGGPCDLTSYPAVHRVSNPIIRFPLTIHLPAEYLHTHLLSRDKRPSSRFLRLPDNLLLSFNPTDTIRTRGEIVVDRSQSPKSPHMEMFNHG